MNKTVASFVMLMSEANNKRQGERMLVEIQKNENNYLVIVFDRDGRALKTETHANETGAMTAAKYLSVQYNARIR